jgi:group I intron endonuclease
MSTAILYSTTGIYLITNTVTGAVYVGSTSISLVTRWQHHRNCLNNQIHRNPRLQRAWNKYGEDAFDFTVAEYVNDLDIILAREQEWIDRYYSLGKSACYNIAPIAGSTRGRETSAKARQNISAAQKRRYSSPTARAQLRKNATQGYITIAARRSKTYEGFISPDGIEYRDVTNLNDFCRQRGLSCGHMHNVSTGKRLSHKGWTAIGADRSRMMTRVFCFISPDGARYDNITHLTEFCKEHRLTASLMSMVYSGKLPYHKGWTKG